MIIANSNYLWGLILIPLLVVLLIFSFRRRKKMMIKFSVLPIFNIDINKIFFIKNYRIISVILTLISISLIIFSLVQPKWGILQTPISVNTYDVVFVLDLSKSMNAEDIKPSRLDRARHEIINFIKNTKNIRVGLVVFAGSNFIASPLTYDIETFIVLLNSLKTTSMTVPGTRIIDAIDTAKNIFIDNSDSTRSLVLITDGEVHTEIEKNIAEIFVDENIRIYSVALGTINGDYIPDFDEKGRSLGYKKDSKGDLILSKRNDTLIKNLSEETLGQFYISDNGDIDFDSIFKNIKEHSNMNTYQSGGRKYQQRYQIFMFIGIVFLIAEILLSILISYKINNISKEDITNNIKN